MEERRHPFLGVAALLFSLFCRTDWFTIVDVWDRSPLAVNEASHGLGGEEVETPSPQCTISIKGPKWPLWLCLSSINSEVFNYSSFSSLILKLALLHCW
jgi:hypothetical protein